MRVPSKPAAPLREEQDCLNGFASLSGELRRAILAIAANDAEELDDSLVRQAQNRAALESALVRFERSTPPSPAAKARILYAARELADLNEQYAALVAHSGESVRLLAALHGAMQHAARGGQSWRA